MVKSRKKINSRGFSLVELVVAMAVASVVVLLVGSLMTNGSKWFSSENTKVTIQNELQEISEQLESAIMETTYLCIDTSDTDVSYVYTGKWNQSENKWTDDIGTERVIICKGSKLYLRTKKIDKTDIDSQDKGYELSDKVSDFKVNLNNTLKDWPEGETHSTAGYVVGPVSVNVNVVLTYNKKTMSLSKEIRLRNKMTEIQITDASGNMKTYSVLTRSQAAKYD